MIKHFTLFFLLLGFTKAADEVLPIELVDIFVPPRYLDGSPIFEEFPPWLYWEMPSYDPPAPSPPAPVNGTTRHLRPSMVTTQSCSKVTDAGICVNTKNCCYGDAFGCWQCHRKAYRETN